MTFIVNNLSKKYGENWIIRDVSLKVERGEILGIFGAVGEGKTALIRSLAGIESISGGSIFFDSIELTSKPCEERNVHFPNLTNESFWKSLFNTTKSSELADGEGQVLALEDALQKAEGILLLDNQFCYMDRQTREDNCEKLRRTVKEKKLAIVFATNDFDEIFSICDRVAILHGGEIIQTGTPEEVYKNPNSVVSARITGRNNLISAKYLDFNENGFPAFQTVCGEHKLFTGKFEDDSDLPDENLTLAIRPEQISISFGASFPEDNLLKAKITNIVFRGETTLILLDANGLELTVLVMRVVGLNIGDECMVGLPPDRIQILTK